MVIIIPNFVLLLDYVLLPGNLKICLYQIANHVKFVFSSSCFVNVFQLKSF